MAKFERPQKPVKKPALRRACFNENEHKGHGWYEGPDHDEYFCEGRKRG